MDAMQPWLLASGAAVGAGILGAAASRAWFLHRTGREARNAAAMIATDAPYRRNVRPSPGGCRGSSGGADCRLPGGHAGC